MQERPFPVIDPVATGKNIQLLREQRGMTVRDLQGYFNFEGPRAIYKWQSGKCLPTVDNLLALSVLLGVAMEDILVRVGDQKNTGPQETSCDPAFLFRTDEKGNVDPANFSLLVHSAGSISRISTISDNLRPFL